MRPRATVYRLAGGTRDRRACQALARSQGLTDVCSFPTVLAERDGHLLGFLATQRDKRAVIAGPLVIAEGLPRPIIVIMRLIEAYEVMLKKAGVHDFFFHIAPTSPIWRRIVEKMGHVPYAPDSVTGGQWYQRKVS